MFDRGEGADRSDGFDEEAHAAVRKRAETGAEAVLISFLAGGTPRRFAHSTLRRGGLAAAARLGEATWHRHHGTDEPEAFETPSSPADIARLVHPMVAGAQADGHIDREERIRILETATALDIGEPTLGCLRDALRQPPSIDDLVAQVLQPMHAAQIYLAALLTTQPGHPRAEGFLCALSQRLGLTADLERLLTRVARAQTSPGSRALPGSIPAAPR